MNGKDLIVGMSFVDEKFIQEAETKQIKKSRAFFVRNCRKIKCTI